MNNFNIYIVLFIVVTNISCGGNPNPENYNSKSSEKNKLISDFQGMQENIYPMDYEKISISHAKDYEDNKCRYKEFFLDFFKITRKSCSDNRAGIYFTVTDQSEETIYRSNGMQDSWRLDFIFFKSKIEDKYLVFAEIGAEESWGFYMYLYKNGVFRELDFFNIVMLDDTKVATSVLSVMEISEKKKDVLKLEFPTDMQLYDNDLDREIKGADVVRWYDL